MDPRMRRVSNVMQSEMATLAPDEHLDLAEDVMRLGRVRHLPVVEDSRLVGIVSSRDLLAASLAKSLDFDAASRRAFIRSIEVSEAMSRDVVTVEPDATLREAARVMVERKIGCLPVVKPDRTLVGLLTETDLLRAALIGGEDEIPIEAEEGGEGTSWADLGEKLADEFEALRRVRDELRVQVHLGKAEAQDVWEKMERKFDEVEAKVKLVSRVAEQPVHDVGEAARALLREIRDGYRRIREAL